MKADIERSVAYSGHRQKSMMKFCGNSTRLKGSSKQDSGTQLKGSSKQDSGTVVFR